MALISLSLDDDFASLELRERVTLTEETTAKVLRALLGHRNISAAVVTSTCLRTLVVVESDRFHGAIDEITSTLSEITGVDAAEFEGALSIHFDRGVANHVFSVAAGLKSVVPGEFEILGQLRRALELASDEHVTSPALTDLFQRALASGRRVRNETTIARGTTSFAHAAVASAFDHLPARDLEAVVVGAGQLATGIVRTLLTKPNVISVTVLNRTLANATALAERIGDARVAVRDLEALAETTARADVVLVAADVPTPVVEVAHVAQRSTPVVLVDLAVPRGISRDVETLSHVTRLDIGTLRAKVEQALDERRDAIADAEAIVRDDVEKFLDDQRARGAAAMVAELREFFDDVVEVELARRMGDLDGLTDEQRDVVRSVVRSVVAKVAHRPTTALKAAAGTDQGLRLSEATRTLFGLS